MQNRNSHHSAKSKCSALATRLLCNQRRLGWIAGMLIVAQFSTSLQATETRDAAIGARTQIVYLNTATVDELVEGLVGVGQSRAEAIVAYRQRVGDFRNDDELSQVRGIGPHVLKANKARISYAPSVRGAAADERRIKPGTQNERQ